MKLYIQCGGEMVPLAKGEQPDQLIQHWVKADEVIETKEYVRKMECAIHRLEVKAGIKPPIPGYKP